MSAKRIRGEAATSEGQPAAHHIPTQPEHFYPSFNPNMMAGGYSDIKPVDEEVAAICEEVRAASQAKAQADGWNGVFVTFKPVAYRSQVRGGKSTALLKWSSFIGGAYTTSVDM